MLAACLGVMAGFGSLFVYTFAVFVKPLGAQFGWNRESVSFGFAIAAMTVGLSSPLIGGLIDRFGPRRIILPCMSVFGCAIASLALLHSALWQFYATCFVIGVVVMTNAFWEPLAFELPALVDQDWCRFVDTMREAPLDVLEFGHEERLGDRKSYTVGPRSVVVLIGKA